MPGFLFHLGGTAICPHAGQVMDVPTNTRVLTPADVKFSWDKTELHPNEVLHLTLEWFTELVVDDLKYGFKLLGKYFPFGD